VAQVGRDVGLDVHARSVVACGLDGQTVELFERRLLHLGEIVAVTVPSVEQEAARDLVRAREDVRADLTSARHRLSKLLLRQGIVYSGGAAWTGPHDRWLRAQRHERVFDTPGLGTAFDIAYDTVLAATARRDRLDTAITAMAADSTYTPVATRLGCVHGVATLTAFALAVEIGDWHRLTGRSIGAYLGLVPTESSSGASRSQGSITKTGNGHARPAADRGCLASSPTQPDRRRSAPPSGRGRSGRAPPRPAGQPPSTPALGRFRRPPETHGRGQHRRRPRAGRLVLVPGRSRPRTKDKGQNVRTPLTSRTDRPAVTNPRKSD